MHLGRKLLPKSPVRSSVATYRKCSEKNLLQDTAEIEPALSLFDSMGPLVDRQFGAGA